jgi:protein TonB
MKKSILALVVFVTIAPAVALAQDAIRVGGDVKAPERVRYVPPVYPEFAKSASVQGIVILEAVVGTSGTVTDVKVLKSIPLLDQAAIDAVSQWAYTPTTLNGVPVPVIMTVTVNFSVANSMSVPPQFNNAPVPVDASISGLNEPPPSLNGKVAVRIGGAIKAPERATYVAPVYPGLAQDARVSGIVIIEAVIDEAGNVATAKVLKSIPLLDQAALDSVMQWKYIPTMMNGVPVPVVMTVTVNFTLQ